MQRQHSSQATPTLGNTPNLNIGSYDGKHYIGSQTKETLHNELHQSHIPFVKVAPLTTFTSWSQHHFAVIGKAEQQVRKASHCGSKQHLLSHIVLILFLPVCATYTWVLFFTHIPFVVNCTFNMLLTDRLQHMQQGWLDFLK